MANMDNNARVLDGVWKGLWQQCIYLVTIYIIVVHVIRIWSWKSGTQSRTPSPVYPWELGADTGNPQGVYHYLNEKIKTLW
jgi:hypothetical protein